MTRRSLIALQIAGTLLFTLRLFPQAPLPAAATLLDRYVEVTGGKKAYENRKSEFARGTIEAVAQGLKGTVVRYANAKGNYYSSLEIRGIGTIEEGVRDGIAWERSDLLGARVKEGVERAQALREATLNSVSRWRELFPKVETTGLETVNGEACYRVEMTPTEGKPQILYLGRESGLGVKMTTVSVTQMGDVPSETIMSAYRSFGGLLEPTKVVQKAAGQELILTLESLEVNAPIPAGRFDFPEEVQTLLAKRSKQ